MAVKRTVQVYGSVTATASSVASIQVPSRAKLKGVLWSVDHASTIGALDIIQLELSVNAASQSATNDATGIISVFAAGISLTTSGAANQNNGIYHPVDVQFNAGDKIYLHATESGGATWRVRALLFFE